MDSTTAFVTGGSGFLGRRLIRYLRQRGQPVRAIGRSAKARDVIKACGGTAVPGDLDDVAALRAAMEGCAVVYHSAAKAEDWGDPADFQRSNVTGTENVLAAARAAKVACLCHVSTEAVLISGAPLVNVDETEPLPAHPLGLYSLTKGLAEQRVRAASGPDLRTVIVRPRFIWGKDDSNLLPRLTAMARKGQFAWIGGGRHLTSTCHVTNVCEGMVRAAERGGGGEIYFLTDGAPVVMRDFLTALLRTQGVEAGDRSVPLWLARVIARVGEAAARAGLMAQPPLTQTAVALIGQEVTVNDGKARRELGYQVVMTREAGLAELQAG